MSAPTNLKKRVQDACRMLLDDEPWLGDDEVTQAVLIGFAFERSPKWLDDVVKRSDWTKDEPPVTRDPWPGDEL